LLAMAQSPWGRGTGEGIGLSGHKNEFKSGVRIGNWVEEQFGAESALVGDALMDFMKKKEAEDIASARRAPANGVLEGAVPPMRVEPKTGVSGSMLFSHGPEFGLSFSAAMTALHFNDPAQRDPDMISSNDRVHKTFFYGSKHIDYHVPKVSPNPRLELSSSKKALWTGQTAQPLPVSADMYKTTNNVMGY